MTSRILPLLVVFISGTAAASAAEADLRLIEAVREGNRPAVRALVKSGVDVNAAQADGATALAWAAYLDDLETADVLLRAGAKPSLANEYGVTPLSLACGKASASMVERLLKDGADPNAATWAGETPIMTCARTGNPDAVKALIAAKADVNHGDARRGQTALMWAAADGHPEVVRTLIAAGANVNAASHMLGGFKPLTFITYGVTRRVPGALDVGGPDDVHPDPASSKGGFTALMFAARRGNLESARLLVEAGADVSHSTPDYGSALLMATASGHEAVALYLIDHGASPNVADVWGFTPLHYALQEGITAIGMSRDPIPTDQSWLLPNMPPVVKALLEHGADPNARATKGFPPFDHAPFARTTGNSMPSIRQPGVTAFLLAAASLDVNLMRLLVAHGADPSLKTNEGTTPLMAAAGVGRQEDFTPGEQARALEAATLAVELGNDINAANDDGRTALAAAAYMGADPIIELLAAKGVDLNAKDRYGQTALSIAQGLAPRAPGGDKRFRRGSPRKSTAALLLNLGAEAPPARNSGSPQ